MSISFYFIFDYTQKRENVFCLENAIMYQIQDVFENR